MATAYDMTAGDLFYPADGIPHAYGSALYCRLMRSYYYNTADNGKFSVWKSIDNGVTWAMQGAEKGGEDNRFAIPGKGVVVGSVLYIAFYTHIIPHVTGAPYIGIARFDMATDSWLSDWTPGPSITDFCHVIDVGFGADGNGVVVYSDWKSSTNTRQLRYVSISSGGTWGSPSNLTDFLQTNTSYAQAIADSTDAEHVFYSDSGGAGGGLYHVDKLGGPRVFNNTSSPYTITRRPVLANIGGTQHLVLPYYKTSLVSGIAVCPVGSSTWTEYPATAAGTKRTWGICSRGNKVYVQWAITSDLDVITQGEFSEGSWSNFVELTSGGPEFGGPFASNMLGSAAVGVVAEDWNDGRAWFIRYPVGIGPASRYYAM